MSEQESTFRPGRWIILSVLVSVGCSLGAAYWLFEQKFSQFELVVSDEPTAIEPLGEEAAGELAERAESEEGAPRLQVRPRRQAVASLRDLNEAFVQISEQVRPSVVTVFTERVFRVQRNPFFGGGSLFDQFFRDFMQPGPNFPGQEEEQRRQGLGSGVVVSSDGYILTNNHVIAEADTIRVRLLDNRSLEAKVIGTDAQTDIAVIKIEATGLQPIKVGDSDRLRVGEMVLAIGSPMSANLAHTVTQGIVSAKGRSNVGLADYEDFIQTDAAVNPGNSGGALVNLDGELVGINTAIVSRSGGFQGISFAVPINMARSVQLALMDGGKVVRGYLGVMIQDISEEIAKAMGLDSTRGVLVADVTAGGPAEKAQMKSGDIVLKIEDEEANSSTQLRNRIARTAPGTQVEFLVWRDGQEIRLKATLETLPDESSPESSGAASADQLKEKIGFSVAELSAQIRSQLGLSPNASGVIVAEVDRNGSAARAGLRPQDVIVSVNRAPVTNLAEFQKRVAPLKKGDSLLLQVLRRGGSSFLAFTL
ncbi:MAG: DegQ family serine endoprotease [Bradymonadales bacterium]|nr:MAG: DegQ family serine endoprotease [Bradymonadales bacterium]